jgi:trans-aconitate 2-methyltransferase
MEKSYKEVSDYYDQMWADLEKQNKAGINSRHRTILNKLKKVGLKKDSTVLEIGCGIGTLSGLIAKQVSKGFIVAADISPESIEFARSKYKDKKNMEFVVSDMTNFSHQRKFDFIVLPDVLEHIPVDAHDNIFATIKNLIHQDSIIFINIPNPKSLEWFHKNQPEVLQIIDQPIYTDRLLSTAHKHGFYMFNLETYSLYYNEPDYQNIIFKVNKPIEKMSQKPLYKVLWNNLMLRLFS